MKLAFATLMICMPIISGTHVERLQLAKVRTEHPFLGQPQTVTTRRYQSEESHFDGVSIKLSRREKKDKGVRRSSLKRGGIGQWFQKTFRIETPQLPGDTRIFQKNNDNLEYVGKLYMGSDRYEVDLVYDTGSSWTVVNDLRCDRSCKGLEYDA